MKFMLWLCICCWIQHLLPWLRHNQARSIHEIDASKALMSALQGSLDRRNYTGLFQQLEVRPDIYKNKLFEIQTYAWGGLEEEKIPKPLRPKIIAKEGLDFPVSHQGLSRQLGCSCEKAPALHFLQLCELNHYVQQ